MSRVCMLGSSSSGNSACISGGETALLIDAGVSCRAIFQGMAQGNISPEKLRGILITHEHIDHIRGLSTLLKRLSLPLYATPQVLGYIETHVNLPAGARLLEADPEGFMVGEIFVEPFQTPHDSVGSLGFRLAMPDGADLGYATDLGWFSESVGAALMGCTGVVLEANYDEAMLETGPYPPMLKRRIRGAFGHLSNRDCGQAAARLAACGGTHFMLAHLSQENNNPETALAAVSTCLEREGLVSGRDFTLQAAPRTGIAQMIL